MRFTQIGKAVSGRPAGQTRLQQQGGAVCFDIQFGPGFDMGEGIILAGNGCITRVPAGFKRDFALLLGIDLGGRQHRHAGSQNRCQRHNPAAQ